MNGSHPNPTHSMKEEVICGRKELDEVYSVGFRNGQIEMKNKVLKSINRDYNLLPFAAVMVRLMKKINKLPLSKPKL